MEYAQEQDEKLIPPSIKIEDVPGVIPKHIDDTEVDEYEETKSTESVNEKISHLTVTETKGSEDEDDVNGNPFGSSDDLEDTLSETKEQEPIKSDIPPISEEKIETPEDVDISGTNESTNPFGSESESESCDEQAAKAESTNPFGSGDEDNANVPGNPFGDFEDAGAVVEEASSFIKLHTTKNPFKAKTPPKRPPPPKISPAKMNRKKKKAPPPPPISIRPKRPPPPKPKEAAPGYGHPLVKRDVENDEEEIKKELEKIELEVLELQQNGEKLEDLLRFSKSSGEWRKEDDGLMADWMEIVNKRNELSRKEAELGYKLRLTQLEMKHAELEFEMRKILHKPCATLSEADKDREKDILQELVLLVDKRDKMVEHIELERRRSELKESEQVPEVTQTPPKVKKKRVVTMKSLKSIVKKKDKKNNKNTSI